MILSYCQSATNIHGPCINVGTLYTPTQSKTNTKDLQLCLLIHSTWKDKIIEEKVYFTVWRWHVSNVLNIYLLNCDLHISTQCSQSCHVHQDSSWKGVISLLYRRPNMLIILIIYYIACDSRMPFNLFYLNAALVLSHCNCYHLACCWNGDLSLFHDCSYYRCLWC